MKLAPALAALTAPLFMIVPGHAENWRMVNLSGNDDIVITMYVDKDSVRTVSPSTREVTVMAVYETAQRPDAKRTFSMLESRYLFDCANISDVPVSIASWIQPSSISTEPGGTKLATTMSVLTTPMDQARGTN